MYDAKMRTRLCLPQGHCGSSRRLGLYSRVSPTSLPVRETAPDPPRVLSSTHLAPRSGRPVPWRDKAELGRGSRSWFSLSQRAQGLEQEKDVLRGGPSLESSVDATPPHCPAQAKPRASDSVWSCSSPEWPPPDPVPEAPSCTKGYRLEGACWCCCSPWATLFQAVVKARGLPSSVLAGADLVGAGLCLDPGRVRGTLGRGVGSRPWLSVLCVTRALVGYRNFA